MIIELLFQYFIHYRWINVEFLHNLIIMKHLYIHQFQCYYLKSLFSLWYNIYLWHLINYYLYLRMKFAINKVNWLFDHSIDYYLKLMLLII